MGALQRSRPEDVLWFYQSLAEIYWELRPGAMAEEFAHEVERRRQLAPAPSPGDD
jgi:hypothetical protein